MTLRTSWILGILSVFVCAVSEAGSVSFIKDLAPVIRDKCLVCHDAEKAKGGYRMDTFRHLMSPGDSERPPLTARDPEASFLYQLLVSDDEDDRMPQKDDPLPSGIVVKLRTWIEEGAVFDGDDPEGPWPLMIERAEGPMPPERYPRPLPITALAVNPTKGLVATSGFHEVLFWHLAEGRLLGRVPQLPRRIEDMAFTPDGAGLIAVGGDAGRLGEWIRVDVESQQIVMRQSIASDVLWTLDVDPTGQRVAIGGCDGVLRVLDLLTGQAVFETNVHADWLTDLSWHPSGGRLLSASRDRSARVTDLRSGQMLGAVLDHEASVDGVCWTQGGEAFVSVGADSTARRWLGEAMKAQGRQEFRGRKLRHARGVGDRVVIGAGREVLWLDPSQGLKVVHRMKCSDDVLSLAVEPQGQRVVAGCYDGSVWVGSADSADKDQHHFKASP